MTVEAIVYASVVVELQLDNTIRTYDRRGKVETRQMHARSKETNDATLSRKG
jgi:hypothetical protein